MFECDFADMCAGKNYAYVDRGTSNTIQCAKTGSKDPIGASRYSYLIDKGVSTTAFVP